MANRRDNLDSEREKRDEAKAHFQEAQKCFQQARGKVIVSFDLEMYEHDHDKVLEIGYIVVRLGSVAPEVTEKCHLIIRENVKYRNKDFVPDNRDGFRFGQSKTVPQKEALETFRHAVEKSAFLVAHSAKSDKSYLNRIGVDLAKLKKKIIDTQMIEQHKEFAVNGLAGGNRLCMKGLQELLTEYNVVYRERDLHNAGCDAYYTMKAFLRQMGFSASVVNALA